MFHADGCTGCRKFAGAGCTHALTIDHLPSTHVEHRSSDMGCCFEEAPAEAQADAKPSYYPGIDHHGDEYDAILPYSEGFLCNW